MEDQGRSARLADSRFEDAKVPKKKKLPHNLHWFLKQEYLADEMLGISPTELQSYISISEATFKLFEQATELVLKENKLISFGIPSGFHDFFKFSWNRRSKIPFLYGRMDVNGVLGQTKGRVIEFNADTCSTLPETMVWQNLQQDILGEGYEHFNYLEESMGLVLGQLFQELNVDYQPAFLGSALGYQEDIENVNMVLKVASTQGFHPIYANLEDVSFSEDGVFVQRGEDYIPIDVLFKFFPWDWMINDEPELAELMKNIVMEGKCIVLNPFYTTLWQNKKFLAFISERFDNELIAKTFTDKPIMGSVVSKPIYGRIGENVSIRHSRGMDSRTSGDYGSQSMIHQEFVPNPIDEENYTYQAGVFIVGHKAVALNFRCSDKEIINDDCEFFCHFIQ